VRRRLLWVGALLAALAMASTAHYPLFVADIDHPERAEVIEDITRARAYFGRLEVGQIDYFRFQGTTDQTISFEILVPQRDELRGFRPEVVVAGPGFDEDCGALRVEEEGCARVPASSTPASVYEGFTQSYYYSYAEPGESRSTLRLPGEGEYLVAVRADDETLEGPYALGFGTEQHWGVAEVLGFPLQWVSARLWYFS
jgi:hypothetical protein